MSSNITPATRQLTKSNVDFALHSFAFVAERGGLGQAASEALGAEPARVLKTLIIETDAGLFAMALLRVDAELDLKAAASALGAKRAAMAEPKTAERITGYVKGGISPFGQKKRLPTLIDQDALAEPTIFVSGGRRGLEIEIDPQLLVAALEAKPADLRR